MSVSTAAESSRSRALAARSSSAAVVIPGPPFVRPLRRRAGPRRSGAWGGGRSGRRGGARPWSSLRLRSCGHCDVGRVLVEGGAGGSAGQVGGGLREYGVLAGGERGDVGEGGEGRGRGGSARGRGGGWWGGR